MASTDKTRIPKPSPIVEDEQGQLIAKRGISREVIDELSKVKGEPDWMRQLRLKSFEIFQRKPIPTWGVDLSDLDLDELVLYSPPEAGRYDSWDDVPAEMKQTYEDLGIPQAEREHLAGVVGVWRQEPVYEGLKKEYADMGIIFTSMDTAIQEHGDLVQDYFMKKCVPPQDNKFSALHGAVWSGGSFLYVPKGVKVDLPAPGLLPDGGRQRGHLRAHAHHRRRGLGRELHRGLHGADLLGQLDALGGRRDLREGGRQGPLHNRAELVQGRLQPEHQARDRGGRGHRRVGRRVDGRQEGHALPRLLPDGRGRPRRPPQRGRGQRRRVEGHRREGRAPGPQHHLQHPRQVHLQGRRHHGLPRAGRGWATTRRAPSPTSSATA